MTDLPAKVRPAPKKDPSSGKLVKGNKSGGNNPLSAKRAMNIKRMFRKAVTLEEFGQIVREVKGLAMMQAGGEKELRVKLDAAKFLIEQYHGKAKQQIDVTHNDNRVDAASVTQHFYQVFGLTDIAQAPQTKAVEAISVIDAPALPSPGAGPVKPVDGVSEAVDRGPGVREDR